LISDNESQLPDGPGVVVSAIGYASACGDSDTPLLEPKLRPFTVCKMVIGTIINQIIDLGELLAKGINQIVVHNNVGEFLDDIHININNNIY